MNVERINELEKFADDFNKKLEEAYKNYEETLEKEKYDSNKTKTKNTEKKKKLFTENIFKDPPSWKPNNNNPREFEIFKKLDNHYEMDNWEVLRINMAKRSYQKEKELPKQTNFLFPKSSGQDFGDQKNFSKLSELGQSIISKFVKDNQEKELKLKKKEEEIISYKYSKPTPKYNPWKFSNHIIKEFSTPTCDKIHSFKTEQKRKFLIQEPFRIPKSIGENFEKSVKLI